MSEKKSLRPNIVTALKLMIISTAVVLLVVCVNYVTKDRVAANMQKKTDTARAELLPDGDIGPLSFQLTEQEKAYVTEIYSVKIDGYITGYCIAVRSMGFGGEMSLLVGITSGSKIAGVKVISHTETPSIGAPALAEDTLLDRYNNIFTTSVPSVDSVSGATYTSEAVNDAVRVAATLAERIISENG